MKIGQLIFFFVMIIHWISCVWYLIVKEEGSWMPPKDMDSGETNFYTTTDLHWYSICFYYSILTMAGEELAPVTNIQIAFAISVVVSGALFSAFIFGNMAAL